MYILRKKKVHEERFRKVRFCQAFWTGLPFEQVYLLNRFLLAKKKCIMLISLHISHTHIYTHAFIRRCDDWLFCSDYCISSAQVFMLKVILAFRVVLPRCRAKAQSLSPGSRTGSRRGSHNSSGNASAASVKSNKSPNHTNNVTDPLMENVTVEILDTAKA